MKIYIVKWDWADCTYGAFTTVEKANEALISALKNDSDLKMKDLIIEVIELDKFYDEGWPGTKLGDEE